MTQAVSKEYADQYDIFHFSIADDGDPDARKKRDGMAREMRKAGWTVECKKVRMGFADLLRCSVYTLDATRRKKDNGSELDTGPEEARGP